MSNAESSSPLDPSLDYFLTHHPRCTSLLRGPDVTVFLPGSHTVRDEPQNKTRDQFFGRTLRSDTTIPYSVSFFRAARGGGAAPCRRGGRGAVEEAGGGGGWERRGREEEEEGAKRAGETRGKAPDYVRRSSNLHRLEPGVNGFDGVCHGGVLASLLDEAMGVLIEVNQGVIGGVVRSGGGVREGKQLALAGGPATTATVTASFSWLSSSPALSEAASPDTSLPQVPPNATGKALKHEDPSAIFAMHLLTASMDVKYLRPLRTPCVALAEARILHIEGRKMRMAATVTDLDGNEFATAEALWVGVAREKL